MRPIAKKHGNAVKKTIKNANDPRLRSIPAVAGNALGVVDVPNRTGFIYALGRNNTPYEVSNQLGKIPAGHPIIIGKYAGDDQTWHVLFIHNVFYQKLDQMLKLHAADHSYGGRDPVAIWLDQWMWWKIDPLEDFTIRIYRATFKDDADLILPRGIEDVDLSSHVPASGCIYVLIELLDDGTISVVDGSDVGDRTNLTDADIPAATTGAKRLYAISLYAGQTKLSITRDWSDFYDLRLSDLGSGGGGGATPGGADGNVQYNDAGALGGEADFIWDKILKQLWIGGAALSNFTGKGIGIIAEGGVNDVARNRLFHFGTQTSGPGITTGSAGGTRASPTPTTNGKVLGQWGIVGFYDADEDDKKTIGYIRAIATDDHSTGDQPFKWQVFTCPAGSDVPTLAFTIEADGSINFEGNEATNAADPTAAQSLVTQAWADANKQPLDADLTAIAALAPSNDDIIQRKAGAWVARTLAQYVADILSLITGTFVPYTSANDIFRCDNPGGVSLWTGTISGAPSGATVTVSAPTSGTEAVLVPTSTSQLAKMRVYNLTRGDYGLISNYNTGTNQITLTASAPGSWANGDSLTIVSPTVSGGGFNWFDLEFTDANLLARSAMSMFGVHNVNPAGSAAVWHPTETFGTGKIIANNAQVASVSNWVAIPGIKMNGNLISMAWGGSPSFVFLRVAGYYR